MAPGAELIGAPKWEAAMRERIKLSREELYNRVWGTPAYKLGPELGLSGRGLGKLCEREGIPVPERGFWARKACGQNPSQPKLPPRTTDQSKTIEFARNPWPVEEDVSLDPVPVADIPHDPQVTVAATLKASRKGKKQEDGRVGLWGPGGLSLQVSKGVLDRALRILDAFVKAVESAGCTIRPAQDKNHHAAAVRDVDAVGFSLEEELSKTERELRLWQLKDKEKNPWKYYRPTYDYAPTGKLVLRIDGSYGSKHRRTWKDGRRSLEQLLPRAVQSILRALEYSRVEREERERQRQESERREKARLEANLRQFQDDRRAKIVRQRAGWWTDAKALRLWLADVRVAAGTTVDGASEAWIAWTEGFIKRLEEQAVGGLPAFEREPNNDEKREYGLWGY